MGRLILVQFMTTVVAGAVAGLWAGPAALFSALLGGLCCVVPNALFAWHLNRYVRLGRGARPAVFWAGEFSKVALTVALLSATVWLYRDLNWLGLLVGFVVALKSYIILLLFRR